MPIPTSKPKRDFIMQSDLQQHWFARLISIPRPDLKPDREIDAAAGILVMGWNRNGGEIVKDLPVDDWVHEHDFKDPAGFFGILPRYTKKPKDDFAILKQVRDNWLFGWRHKFMNELGLLIGSRILSSGESVALAECWLQYEPGDYARASLNALLSIANEIGEGQ